MKLSKPFIEAGGTNEKIMKVKLLKRLRRLMDSELTVRSITKTNGTVTGMSYAFSKEFYRGIWDYGDTEEDVKKKVRQIYWDNNAQSFREKYKRYSVKNKNQSPNDQH